MRKRKQIVKQNSFTEFLLYTTPNGKVKVEIFLHDENIWLTQAKIAELFGVDRTVVTKHLQNIFKEGELDKKSTSAKIAQVQNEGHRQVTREVAETLVLGEYEKYKKVQDKNYISDFDILTKKLLKKNKK